MVFVLKDVTFVILCNVNESSIRLCSDVMSELMNGVITCVGLFEW